MRMTMLFCGQHYAMGKSIYTYTLMKVHFWERGKQEWESILGPMASVVKLVLI